MHSGGTPRWRVVVLTAAILAEVSVAGSALVADRDPAKAGRQPPSALTGTHPTASPSPSSTRSGTKTVAPRPATSQAVDTARAERVAAARTLLTRRATAVRRRDRAAFAGTLDQRRRSFYRSQLRMFDNLAGVSLASWSYRVDEASDLALPPMAKRYAADEVFAPAVSLAYALKGANGAANSLDQYFTLVRRGPRWLVAGDTDFDRSGSHTDRELWDYGPVVGVQGKRTVVLGAPQRRGFLQMLAATTDAAIPRVSAVWGSDWPQRVVVVVPRSQEQVADLLGEKADLSQIAAVAVARVDLVGSRYRAVGNRVIVNPGNFDRLGPVGRQIVMRHEVTHVASREGTGANVPAWLTEGLADYVGYLGSGVTAAGAAPELRRDLLAGRPPGALPADRDFDGANKGLPQAYEGSWLAARMIVAQTSQRTFVRFYRTLGRDRSPTRAAALRAAMKSVLRTTPASFTKAWQAYVRATLV